MLLIIIWYFFIIIFGLGHLQPPEIGLGVGLGLGLGHGLGVLASFNITALINGSNAA